LGTWFRRLIAGLLGFSLLLTLDSTNLAQAQSGRRCFAATGYCIAGRIRQYWEQNGGLMVFGYPITPQQQESVEGRPTQVQWFERNRLELHPQNARPYDVLLGRIGVERLMQQGRDWQTFARESAEPGCRLFAETGHAICGDILAAWRASGLNFDGDPRISEQESLGLFGLPLSDARSERQPDGQLYVVQWFERARFELHPENKPPYRVLLGLLGRESSPTPSASPAPVVASAPTRLVIGSIGLDKSVVGVGTNASGELIVPDHDIGWYTASAAPGQGENVVFWAHVLRFRNAPKIPAPFERLKELPIGARVTVYDDLPQGRELVTMVSCYGQSVIVDGSVVDMSHRLITIAEPAGGS
jgi:hypothetical protein